LQLLENLFRTSVEHGSTSGRPRAVDSVEHDSTGSRTRSGDSAEGLDEGVTVTAGRCDDGFYVADDGPGISTDDHESLFEAGYSTSEDGTGFGLAIVNRIAQAHDWTVDVTQSADGGARFEITGVEFE
jgi:signal transduction histidine kinase